MNEQPRPRRSVLEWLQLPEGEIVVSVQAYRVETKKPRKWQFWAKEHIKYNLAALTNTGRFFIIDPDNFTVEEKENQ